MGTDEAAVGLTLMGPGIDMTGAAPDATRPVRILLVEDEEMDYLIVRALLARSGGERFQVERLAGVSGALEVILEARHDVYLVDYMLGTDNGLELMKEAIRRGSRGPFILLTARREHALDVAAMHAGASDFLVKGQIDGALLERSIRYTIAQGRAVAALQESRGLLESALDALSAHIAILDGNGCIVAVNDAWRRFGDDSGCACSGHGVGHNYLDVCEQALGEARPVARSVAAGIREVIAQRCTNFECEYTWQHTSGERWFQLRVSRFADPGQGRVVVAHEDITERRLAERRLAESEAQLRQSQKMEAVGQLAGGVAHDFNNLLTAIRGYAELLLNTIDRDDRRRRDVREIKKAADRAAALTERLLAFGRRQVVQPKVLDLNDVIVDLSSMLHRLIGESIEFAMELTPQAAAVRADSGQLEQVLMNLAVNARDAMPSGGTLTVATRFADLVGDELAAEVSPGRYVVLQVTDTGTGMDEQTRSHLFEPFFTTKGPGRGTGLGLATIYGIVKQGGGHIEVETEPGRGTTFAVFLPSVEEVPELLPAVTGEFRQPPGTETVLLVEDEEAVRQLVKEILEANGYAVLEAASGDQALELSGAHRGPIHLIISDMVMPAMSGRELVQRLTPDWPDMRVLYVSGYTEDELIRDEVSKRAVAFLQKPFTVSQLTQAVRAVLEG